MSCTIGTAEERCCLCIACEFYRSNEYFRKFSMSNMIHFELFSGFNAQRCKGAGSN